MKESYAVLDANHLNLCFLLAFTNLGTRFLLRGVDFKHPKIFRFQDVNRKTKIFS
jgi:hypothetical protein